MKRRLSLLVLLAVPLALSGCLVINSLSVSQLNTVGTVRIMLQACFSQSSGSCTDTGNSASTVNGSSEQPMIGFRVPSGTTPPSSFSTTAGESLTFNESLDYEQKLQTLDPAPAGEYWAGYMAATAVTATDGNNQFLTVAPEFTLRSGSDGSPFAGPFLYRPVVGARIVSSSLLISRALDCGTSLFAPNAAAPNGDTICIDSPSQAATATDLSLATRDLGVLASATVTAKTGSTAQVPFTVKYAGTSTASANFALSATTDLPGATAIPSQGSLLPASDSSNPVNVSVQVPADAFPGTYDVTLSAKLSNGQVRTNTGEFEVKDATKPTVTITLVKGQKTGTLLARGLKLKVKMSEAGRVAFVLSTKLKKTVTLSRKTVSYDDAANNQVKLTVKKTALSPAMRARLRSLSKVKLTLRASAKDTAGNTRAVSKKITLKR